MLINDSPSLQYATSSEKNPQSHVRSLGILQLIALSYFSVSGGPYGIEQIASTAPFLLVLLSFIVVPLIWSAPISLITAELTSMIPEDGGSTLWVSLAFGDAVGWMNAACGWIIFLVDSSLYPAVMIVYLEEFTGPLHHVVRIGLATLFVVIVMLINLRSALEVGWVAELLALITLLPFVLFVICSFTSHSVHPIHLTVHGPPKTELGYLISLSVWNSAGWEDVGMLAGEVRNPTRTFPLGLAGSMLLQTVLTMLPFYIGFGIDSNPNNWTQGYFTVLANRVGGLWLKVLMLIGAFVSNFGLLHANIIASSRLVGWMATKKQGSLPWFPPFLGKLYTKHAVPRAAVTLNCAIIAMLASLPFSFLVQADAVLICLTYISLFVAFVVLRFKLRDTARPFRLPAAHPILSVGYIVIPMVIVVVQAVTTEWKVLVTAIGVIVGSAVVYVFVFVIYKRYYHDRRGYSELL